MPTRDELIAYAISKKGLDRATAEKKADEYLAKQGGGEKPAPKVPAPSAKPKATPSTKAAPSIPAPKVEPPKVGPAVKAEVPKVGEPPEPRGGRPAMSGPLTPSEAARMGQRQTIMGSLATAPADRYMRTSPASPPPEPEGSEVAAKYSGRGYVSGGGGRLSEYENAPMTTEDKRRAAMDAFKDNPAMVTKIKAITKPEQIDDLYAKLQAEE